MRVNHLQIAGFRGVRDLVDIPFPSGFAVISGRNGTGKSSICDAIEFALTGTITKYAESSEKGEDVADYLWWRGTSAAERKFVALEITDDAGKTTTITRRPDGVTISDKADLRASLCDLAVDPEKTLIDVCRTSIIRDEFITRLSVDLAEPDRFNFVKAAVGSASFAATEAKLIAARELTKSRISRTKPEYERARDRVKDLFTELSRARAEVARAEQSADAEKNLRSLTAKPQAEFAELLVAGRKLAPEVRLRIDALSRLGARTESLLKRESESAGAALRAQLDELSNAAKERAAALTLLQKEISSIETRLSKQQETDSSSSSLAQLFEHGSRVGAVNGRCPLCGSQISEANFRAHLAEIEVALKRTAGVTSELVQRRADFNDQEKRASAALSAALRQIEQRTFALESADRERMEIVAEARRFGVFPAEISEALVGALLAEAEASRSRLSMIEMSVAVLEASTVHARIAELQRELSALQLIVVSTERRIAKLEATEQRLRQAAATLKRISSEVVDDRLAAIRPLLAELYVRLRPHVDWPEISYLIRGDTRRFLSLRVGDGLNLRFMFSSGQRRAAGLAFLMAVSLSRPWCLLDSLILDDPVQHIDDFRALHLVESLSALRQIRRQIICTVEDSALADLLVRRLRSSVEDEGVLIEMDYESGRGAFVGKFEEIRPFPSQVLKSA